MRKSFIILLSFGIVFLFSITVVNAEEGEIARSGCGSATLKVLSLEESVKVFSIDMTGISWDTLGKGFSNVATFHCVGTLKIIGGEKTTNAYCKWLYPDGTRVAEVTKINGVGPYKYIGGTGKYEGITGGGKSTTVTKAQPIMKGTFQSCYEGTGTWKIPEKMEPKKK
jgi:hypothetical protein